MCAKRFICYCWFIVTCVGNVTSDTIFLEVNTPTTEELNYLKRYGYLPEGDGGETEFAYTPHSLSEALKKLQAFAGLPETGTFDNETKLLFRKKRCGVKDIENAQTVRSRRYILQEGWSKRSISYRVVNGSSTLEKERIEELIEEALAVWAPHGRLQFHKTEEGHADIQISFVAGDHGDGFPFDGIGRVVAHAFPPPQGSMHFDDDEIWGDNLEDDDEDVTNFFAVAVHEIGHALGLSHSNVKSSVMYPYYQVPVERLHKDDILGMQELYLKDSTAVPDGTETTQLTPSLAAPRATMPGYEDIDENNIPDLCLTNYDTLQVIQGKIYVFEEEWVWVLRDRNEVEDGYPQRFHDVFLGLPAKVNVTKTIYENWKGNIVIFSGREFWEFNPSFQLIRNGTLSEYKLPPQVEELTTVFISNYNNKTYLIEEERYWRFDEITGTMHKGYPKDMCAWRLVPYPVNAAIIWKGDTYFFQGPRFWRFDNTYIKAHDYYPLPTAQIWFPCESTPEMNRYITNDGP